MSLRWRVMDSIVLAIALTPLASVGVGYFATQSRPGEIVDRIGNDEANRLAGSLSREYTGTGGWETFDEALSGPGTSTAEMLPTRGPKRAKRGTPSRPTRTWSEWSSPLSMNE